LSLSLSLFVKTVELLLTAMFFSSLETNMATVQPTTEMDASFLALNATDMPPPPPGSESGLILKFGLIRHMFQLACSPAYLTHMFFYF
jgi:hypothetical protein